uniref:F-box protein At3g07870-like n=1 Tax=Erigeron canadensis TaxID=72917 RepID=UPI001CB90259|nr:F-box protein At3g07870-like [Erigeron canadensis]
MDDPADWGRRRVTGTTTRMSIYSLRSNTWRQLFIDSPYEFHYTSHVVYLNGLFHWFYKKKDTDHSTVRVAFSLKDECFCEVPSSSYCNDTKIMSCCNCKLIVLGGKLVVYVSSEHRWWPGIFEVWLMNEYGVKESWIKIPHDIFDDEFRMVNPMIFDDNGKIRVANKGQMFI